jgi:HJR/Mrr/RecB family endonuclease
MLIGQKAIQNILKVLLIYLSACIAGFFITAARQVDFGADLWL